MKKITMVFDTETAGTLERPLIYDLGLVITDKKGNHLFSKRWLVKEIFENEELMSSAYYAVKIPKYYQGLESITAPFGVIIHELRQILEAYNVSVASAYNLTFDLRAMVNTYMELIGKKFGTKMIWKKTSTGKFCPDMEEMFKKTVLKKELELLCIWSYACEVVLSSRNFQKVAEEENWLTEKGNYLTNAEVTYRYLTGDFAFEETHTALNDSEIETFILFECERKKKAHKAGILFHPWRLVQK